MDMLPTPAWAIQFVVRFDNYECVEQKAKYEMRMI
jgi:hypothetical protein